MQKDISELSVAMDLAQCKTLVDILRWRALHQPDQRAYIFLTNGEQEEASYTYAQVDARARSIAATLQQQNSAGAQVLLLYPPGLEYIAAFMGCLYAKAVAVPAYPPSSPRSVPRIQTIVADAGVQLILTTRAILAKVQTWAEKLPELSALQWLATDEDAMVVSPDDWDQSTPTAESLAFLQYTSGSTGSPKGVMVSHGNLMCNSEMMRIHGQHTSKSVGVSWLPMFHDMGLILGVLQPLYVGFPTVLMAPAAFTQRPLRWLQAISRYQGTTCAAPNFAYEFCISRITPEERAQLHLQSWHMAVNAAEPVRAETIERFRAVFAPCGLKQTTMTPSYGLAETTLMVSSSKVDAEPTILHLDKTRLEQQRILITPTSMPGKTYAIVSCGHLGRDHRVVIVNPETMETCNQEKIGEIWVAGPSMAQGYWQRPQDTEVTFRAYLKDTGEGPFVRTGDLGFIHNGEIFITGRLKDLIIIAGRNYYPQDIELIVEHSHTSLQIGSGAAFSIEMDNEERLVIVQEVGRHHEEPETIVDAINQAITEQCEIKAHVIVLIRYGSIFKTSSGKIQRKACRQAFINGELKVVHQWAFGTYEHTPSQPAPAIDQEQREESRIGRSKQDVMHWLIAQVARRAALEPATIDIQVPFSLYGLGSLDAIGISGDLEQWLGYHVSPTLVYDYPSIETLASYIVDELLLQAQTTSSLQETHPQTINEPVAVIGIGCRFPGANNPEEFWSLLAHGVDAIREFPVARQHKTEKQTPRWGGFLEHVDLFDPRFFGIAPREASSMDPQQRLLLEVAWETLEDAGQSPEKLVGSQTGVFVGISDSDYARLQFNPSKSIDLYTVTGNASSIAANRLSYVFDWRGPSVALDTACSSSLVAIHLACQSLRAGEVQLALAGGVNVILAPDVTNAFAQGQMMASDGRCKTFDVSADGYVRSEGCGLVALKLLSQARRDKDQILAIVRGSAVNQDGRSNGLTAPNGRAQQAVLRQALHNANVAPHQIGYIEAHGTGTALGDPIEIHALETVLTAEKAHDAERTAVALGSVKTNIGHLEAAAGVAGFIKVVLALQHHAIPPHLHLKQLNPQIRLNSDILTIPRTLYPWPVNGKPRFAGVSSFGFGGTNAHVILEEAQASAVSAPDDDRPAHIFTMSAKSESALKALALHYVSHLSDHNEQEMGNVCFTANTGRSHFAHRFAAVAASTEQLQAQLRTFVTDGRSHEARSKTNTSQAQPKIAFLYPGQGIQYPGMAQQLYRTQPTFRHALNQCADILRTYVNVPLPSLLFSDAETSSLLQETRYAQPALFALEYALTQLWKYWGIEPDAVLGHSLGEYTAACVAGVFGLEEGLRLVAERGRLMQTVGQPGKMALVFAGEDHVRSVLTAYDGRVSIAAINGPRNIMVSGEASFVIALTQQLEGEGVVTQLLEASHAFHSPLMEPLLAEFGRVVRQVHFSSPQKQFISTVTGSPMQAAAIPDTSYWLRQLHEPVQFAQGVQALYELGYRIFVELGPQPHLLTMGKRCIPKDASMWLPSLTRQGDDWQCLLRSLRTLYTSGVDVDWDGFDQDYARNRVSLPTYPFERQRYWKDNSVDNSHNHQAGSFSINGSALPIRTGESMVPMQEQSALGAAVRQEVILNRLCAIVGNILEIDPEEIDMHASLPEMGADSLLLLQALQIIRSTFRIELSLSQLFASANTLHALSKYIEQNAPEEVWQSVLIQPAVQPQEAILSPATQLTQQPVNGQMSTLSASITELAQGISSEQFLSQFLAVHAQVMTQAVEMFRRTSNNGPLLPTRAAQPEAPSVSNAGKREGKATGKREETFIPFQPLAPGAANTLSRQQQNHLESLIARYTRRTQTSKQLTQKGRSVLADNRASAGFRISIKEMLYPIIADRAKGAYIWDVDDNQYIDISMGFGVNLFGHNVPFITEAIAQQLETGMPLGPQTSLAGQVATMICELTGMERVTFTNSGTEAVMTALRLARTRTGRTKIALFAGSYHGSFDGVLAKMQSDSDGSPAEPMAPGIPQHIVEDLIVLNYGTEEALEWLQKHVHELAAVLVEPVQSRRPDLQPAEFLCQVRRLTQDAGTALIFDEVITGFRIHPGGAQAWFNVRADLALYGKIIGGGLPIGVVAGKAEYMDGIDGGSWQYGDGSYPRAETTFFAGTFCKHPLAMAASLAVLRQIKTLGPSLLEQLNQRTARLAHILNDFFEQECIPIKIVYFGSLFRFAFSRNMDVFFYHLLEKGIYIWEGRNYFLSTAHTENDIEHIIRAVKESIQEMRAGGFFPAHSSAAGPERATTEPVIETHNIDSRATGQEDYIAVIPLTEGQKHFWMLTQIGNDGLSACSELAVELRGLLDKEVLSRAFQQAMERHEALRTSISPDGTVQYIHRTLTLPFFCLDFSHTTPEEYQTVLREWLHEEHLRGFQLTQGPLFRVHLLHFSTQHHVLVLSAHHIIIDGWSCRAILNEVTLAYSSAVSGIAHPMPEVMQFREYIQWLDRRYHSAQHAANEAYWSEYLSGEIPVLELPTDYPRPSMKTYGGARIEICIDTELLSRLRQVSKEQHCTLYILLLAAYMVLLHRLTNQDDMIVGISFTGQTFVHAEYLVGDCADVAPIRGHLVGKPTFIDYLTTIKGGLLNAYEHQPYMLASLIDLLNMPRDISRTPIVSTLFDMDPAIELPRMGSLEVQILPTPIWHSTFDLGLSIVEKDQALQIYADYNTDLFDSSSIQQLLQLFHTLLAGIVQAPYQPIALLPLLDADERQRLLIDWNQTQRDWPSPLHYSLLFEQQAMHTPERVAVCDQEGQITYAALLQHVKKLAALLHQMDVGPETLVGIYLERSTVFLISMLAVWRCGAAYVPLDPVYPKQRIELILTHAQVPLLLTTTSLLHGLPQSTGTTFCLDQLQAYEQVAERPLPELSVQPQHLAYVIYTSGSTGVPKGVMVTHEGMLNHLWAKIVALDLNEHDVIAQTASQCFDISVWQFLAGLLPGGRIHIFPDAIAHDPGYLLCEMQHGAISILQIVPSLLRTLLNEGIPDNSLRWLIVTGEAMPVELCCRWWQEHSEIRLLNAYGPTECSDDVTHAILEPQESERVWRVPIGYPIANTQMYVLDEYLQPVPPGTIGEIYVGGQGVGRGYLADAARTAEVFLPNPYAVGSRLYRTGDRGRYRTDGQLEFVERRDAQVKIRGNRIELGEIEALLHQYPGVQDVVVIARQDISGSKYLVAYIVATTGVTTNAVRDYLKERLPSYMVPAAIVQLATLPLTPNGKVDRQALPAPDVSSSEPSRPYVAPRTPVEEMLADIWQQLLSVRQIGIDDNFFELGGHSLLASQVIVRAREAFQVDLPLRSIFEAPTIAELAVTVVQRHIEQADSETVAQVLAELERLSDSEAQMLINAEERVVREENAP